MASFDFTLPATQHDVPMQWEGAHLDSDTAIIWGNSKLGMQWGGPKTHSQGALQLSDPIAQADGSYIVTVTLRDPEPHMGDEALGFLSRYSLADGFYGVVCGMLQEGKPARHSA